ncbi:MAG: hypothetical protein HQL93_14170 [Magnetococcales bacterium]|nr:hypothetical protein [Magnetococcales bacterium]
MTANESPEPQPNLGTFAFSVKADKENDKIIYEILDPKKITPDMEILKDDVEFTLVTLHTVFRDTKNKRFQYYFESLLSLAQVGLMGINPLPLKAQHALTTLKNEINIQEAPVIRMGYLKKLGLHAFGQSLLCVFLIWFVHYFSLHKGFFEGREVMHCGVMWIGCMAGVWLSVGMSPPSTGLESLQLIARDSLEPSIRLLFTGLLTIFIALLLNVGVIKITFGELTTTDFLSSFKISLLLGMVCGLGEKALSTTVSQRVDQFFKELNKKGA